jgi:GABA(A) receptor-associated protein
MSVAHFDKTIHQRLSETKQIKLKNPNRVCIYMVKSTNKPSLPDLDKNKYLVPIDITVGQLAYIIRKRIHLCPAAAMFLLINNTMLSTNLTIGELENKYMNEDGFIYIHYTTENCFG